MIVNYDTANGKVEWYNAMQTQEQAAHRLNENTIWYEGTLPEKEEREGYEAKLYYKNGMLVWEYKPEEAPQPSQLDRIEAAANQKNTDIENAAIDRYTKELLEGGVL